jgi:glycosyltransferase involved in cell wall biosynthesis
MKVLIIARHLLRELGGIEIQCDLIARGLHGRGHDVTYALIGDREWEQADVPYGLQQWNGRDVEGLRNVLSRYSPDVIYLRHNKIRLRMIARAAHRAGVPVVFATSSLQDVQPWSFHRSADRMTPRRLASIAWQRLKSRWNWGGFRWVDGAVSLNADYLPRVPVARRVHIPDSMDATAEPFSWPRPFVAWVAQLKDYKHPEAFVELARRCRDLPVDFLMVGGLAHERFAWITRGDGTPPSFHYLGQMSPRQVNGFLAASELMVHTCEPEGFGNNFIQAWQQARPTLSLQFDPEGIIERERLGSVPGTLDGLEADLRRLLADPGHRAAMGARALRHASANYDPATNVARLESFLRDIVASRRHA